MKKINLEIEKFEKFSMNSRFHATFTHSSNLAMWQSTHMAIWHPYRRVIWQALK
jgi:hypothetical protein